MPNGVMAGDGSKGNPFIVMDGYDFNVIRSITTSASDFKYIELGADINLSMYASFVPIPVKYLNIDGKGHTITEINIITSDTTVGLFASLYISEYVKDLTIEGVLVCNTSSTISSGGAFCGRMYLQTDAIISNVEVYFSLTVFHDYRWAYRAVVQQQPQRRRYACAGSMLYTCGVQGEQPAGYADGRYLRGYTARV